MKRFITIILSLSLLALSCWGCSAKKADLPSDSRIKRDVQDYITDMVDSTGVIDIFEKTSAEQEGNDLSVECVAIFNGTKGQQKGNFTLSYRLGGDEWMLEKCRVKLDESTQSADNQTEAPTDAPSPTPEAEATDVPTTEPTATPASQNASLSDNWKDFAFELSGVTYKLPAQYSEFAANGWIISDRSVTEDTELAANSKVSVNLTNGAVEFYVYLINMSQNVRKASDCDVGSIEVEARDNAGFKIAKGIHCLSTVDEVKAAFGNPSSSSSGDDYVRLNYETSDYNVMMSFCIYSSNTKYNSIQLKNIVATDRDNVEVSEESPAYLNTYVKPTQLGSDNKAPIIELDGALYRLPCPLSEFINNGWKIKSESQSYMGARNGRGSVRIEKDKMNLWLTIANYDTVPHYTRDCAVYEINSISLNNLGSDASKLRIPSGVSLLSSAEEVAQAYQDFSVSEYGSTTTYSYKDDDYNYSVSIKYQFDTSYSNSYGVTNRTWDYD